MMKKNVAILGATGAVGREMLKILEERDFPIEKLTLLSSKRSAGKTLTFKGEEITLIEAADDVFEGVDIVLGAADNPVAKQFAPAIVKAGAVFVDNSSAFRLLDTVPLVIPEINGDVLGPDDYIIANPNCSTIQMLMALAPLHKAYGIKRIVVSTYQSVSGSGAKGVNQLKAERAGGTGDFYPHPIDLNTLPHIDVFLDNGYTKEEMKMVNETHKILRDDSIAVTATTVRVPVWGGHSESVNVEFRKPFDLDEARALMAAMPGVVIQDDPENKVYPMPRFAEGKDEVFVGRIRRDFSVENGLNLWCVADNLRKGAATNAVQIAQLLLEKGLLAE